MSNLFGIIKKKTDYKLPSLKVSLKDVYSDNTSLFHFEETFDISKYEDEEFFIIISGFISNLKTICPNYVSESNNHAEIIANIYNQDTKKFQEKLLGNFAIVIYNKKSHDLVLLSDHIGTRPLYIMDQKEFFAFSTDIKILVKASLTPLSLNKLTVIDFLAIRIRDYENTFYEQIYRLGAHKILTFSDSIIHQNLYNHKNTTILNSYKNPIKEFAKKFEEAIQNSYFSHKKIGLMLSGGLDSSAIAIGLKNLKLVGIETFSANYKHLSERYQKLTDETSFQEEIRIATNFNHSFCSLENVSPINSIEKQIDYFHQPVHLPNIYLWEEIIFHAKNKNVNLIFTGTDGDNVISHGLHRFPELLKNLNVAVFLYEIIRFSIYNKVKLRTVIKIFINEILMLWKIKSSSNRNDTILKDKVFFDKRFKINEVHTQVDSHKKNLSSPLHSLSAETRYLFFKYHKVEVRTPFYDIPLIEFCLSLPSRWKLRHGRTRYILRKYLKGQVSDIISDRPNKANLQHGLLENIKNQDVHKINAQLKCIHPFLNDIIDLDKLEKCLDKIKNSGRSTDGELTAILAFYSINFWLNKNSALSSD